MARRIYVGVNNVARKVKKLYVGVDNVARRIKKAYIGVGGIARPCFTGDELAYWGTQTIDNYMGGASGEATTVGNKAMFDGQGRMDVFDDALSYQHFDAYQDGRAMRARGAATVGNYALFAGGDYYEYGMSILSARVAAYDSSLTYTSPTNNLSTARRLVRGGMIGNYALFAGGNNEDSNYVTTQAFSTVDTYDKNLTHGTAQSLSAYATYSASANTEKHVVFAGAYDYQLNSLSNITFYDAALTRTSGYDDLERIMCAATGIGNYIIIAGGCNIMTLGIFDAAIAFDENLTRSTLAPLSIPRSHLAAVTLGKYAIFAGGQDYSGDTCIYYNNTDVYNMDLTRVAFTPLAEARSNFDAATVGSYALFEGSSQSDDLYASKELDVYTIA